MKDIGRKSRHRFIERRGRSCRRNAASPRTLAAAVAFSAATLPSHCLAEPVASSDYEFKGGYPTPETIQRAYDDADLARAIEAYKFFYPTVSIMGTWKGNLNAGTVPNKVLLILHGRPEQLVFTPNSDTPYAGGHQFPGSRVSV
jgi:hypothetical protein